MIICSVLISHCVCRRPSWKPKTQPNGSSAVVWLSFWFSTGFTRKKLGLSCGIYLYMIFRKWRSIRLCQSLQILTYALRFWACSSWFLATRTRVGPLGDHFLSVSQFWAYSGQFCALGVDFGPLRVNYCGHHGVDFWTPGERVFATESLFRASGSLLIV